MPFLGREAAAAAAGAGEEAGAAQGAGQGPDEAVRGGAAAPAWPPAAGIRSASWATTTELWGSSRPARIWGLPIRIDLPLMVEIFMLQELWGRVDNHWLSQSFRQCCQCYTFKEYNHKILETYCSTQKIALCKRQTCGSCFTMVLIRETSISNPLFIFKTTFIS